MAKKITEHKDKLGRILNINDFVAYPSSNSLEFGKVVKLNKKMVGVWPVIAGKWRTKNINKYSNDLVLLDGPDITMYLLRESTK